MVGSNKVLTVSYGTFSCTLEGFDDSFHSMKAIAEYFRDLAQEDRYFGAEPPTPDADMLARIAEREISRRVEAKSDGNGIHLSAAAPAATDDAATAADMSMPDVADVPGTEASSFLNQPQPDLPSGAELKTGSSSFAAKLQKIRTVATIINTDDSLEDDGAIDLPDTAQSGEIADVSDDIPVDDAPAEDILSEDVATDADDAVASSEQDETTEPDVAEDVSADTDAAQDEAAAASNAGDEAEVASADDAATENEDSTDAEETGIDSAWAASALTEAEATDPETFSADDYEDQDEDLSFDLSHIDLSSDSPEEDLSITPMSKAKIVRTGEDGGHDVIPVETDADDTIASVTATLKSDSVAETDEAPAADTPAADDDPEMAAHNSVRAAIAAAMPAGSLSDEDETDLQRELAEVADEVVNLDDEDDQPAVAEVVVSEAEVVVSEAEDTPDLPAEDVADAEVVEAAAAEADTDKPANAKKDTKKSKRKRLPEADYAVTRMIAQTDEALNEPAGSRRRNAIAQLKAAVAATEAARQLGDNDNSRQLSENAFRDDLDQVVRPSRPVMAEDVADRPKSNPLKLVASQRVDSDTPRSTATKPQTRARTVAIDTAEAGGFAQFAATMGATELPDLLEAAAAYTSFVEGVEDFSRPQIMKKVQMTTTEEFSREDGLRSFGTLLRQGRISKVRNGRFQVAEGTRFRPDARSA